MASSSSRIGVLVACSRRVTAAGRSTRQRLASAPGPCASAAFGALSSRRRKTMRQLVVSETIPSVVLAMPSISALPPWMRMPTNSSKPRSKTRARAETHTVPAVSRRRDAGRRPLVSGRRAKKLPVVPPEGPRTSTARGSLNVSIQNRAPSGLMNGPLLACARMPRSHAGAIGSASSSGTVRIPTRVRDCESEAPSDWKTEFAARASGVLSISANRNCSSSSPRKASGTAAKIEARVWPFSKAARKSRAAFSRSRWLAPWAGCNRESNPGADGPAC